MKIAEVYDAPYNERGGISVYVVSFIKNAPEHDFTLWTRDKSDMTVAIGKKLISINALIPNKKKFKFVPEIIRSIFYVWLKLKKISNLQNVIVYNSSTYFWTYIFRKKTIPTILIIHGTNMPITSMSVGRKKAFFVACSDRLAIKKADRVILVSQEGLQYYQDKHPKYKSKMVFYPTFSEDSLFYPKDRNISKKDLSLAGKNILTYVGRLNVQKKVSLVIRIFSQILEIKTNSHLCIVGDGPDRETLIDLTKKLGLGKYVTFYGNVCHEEIPTFFNASDLSFTLSYWEGTAQAILESLACGTPVIVSDVADNRQIITNGKDGFVLDSDDEGKGAEYAIKIMDNYDQFSKNALDKGKGYYASAIVPKIIQEIKSVIEK
ncbi:MAG: glycosyltransferase family 1 protein [Candidatus Kuenenia stuttgartiensis]|nr:glycosyltransferase family 1 protein [Candidatus Kuenenia stuttgartiensis]